MMDRQFHSGTVGLWICGCIAIVVGVWLPWQTPLVQPVEPPNPALVGGFGFVTQDAPVLSILGLVFSTAGLSIALIHSRFRSVGRVLLVLTSIIVMGFPLQRVATVPGYESGAFSFSFFGPGPLVVTGGGAFLLVASALVAPLDETGERSDTDSSEAGRLARPVVLGVSILLGAGLCGLIVGVWLDWIVAKPTTETMSLAVQESRPPLAALEGGLLVVLVGGAVGALSLAIRHRRARLAGGVLCATGLLTMALPVWQFVHVNAPLGTPDQGAIVRHLFGPGAYVTVCAGSLVTVAGTIVLSSDGRGSPTAPSDQRGDREPARVSRVGRLIRRGSPSVAIGGAILVAVGSQLPWIFPLPTESFAISSVGPAMEYGLAGSNEALLGVTVTGMLLGMGSALSDRVNVSSHAFLFAGVFVVVQSVWRLIVTTGRDGLIVVGSTGSAGVADGALFVAPGVFLTIGGGVLLIFAGVLAYVEPWVGSVSTTAPATTAFRA